MSISFAVACNLPLGIISGKFKLVSFSIHPPETHSIEAKINVSGGYRAAKEGKLEDKFVSVEFETETVVTGVATQGFGDPEVEEWVEQYYVGFTRQSSTEKLYVKDSRGRPKVKGVSRTENGTVK